MARRQSFSRLGGLAGESGVGTSIDDLDSLGALLVVIESDLAHILVARDLALVELGYGIGIALDSKEVAGLGRITFLDPLLEAVEDMNLGVAEDTEGPANTRGTKYAELRRIVDNNSVVSADAQLAHGLSKVLGAG